MDTYPPTMYPPTGRCRLSLSSVSKRTQGYLAGSAAILCTGGLDVIRKEAWPFYRTISGVRLYRVLEEPKGPKGSKKPPPRRTLQ